MSDYSDVETISLRMMSATKKLHEMAGAVGSARQVKEFCGDLRRNALSAEVVKYLREGDSAAAAEHKARASEAYTARLDALMKHYGESEKVIAEWSAEQASYDAARSLLSFQKQTMRELQS